ncbi:MAG: TetR/AcrR family transcriptional regulator [Pseudooceanicola nanhaiensis]
MRQKRASDTGNTDPARIDRRTQIIEEASLLFSRRGYLGTSLRDVADRCDMTKAALYYYFPDKESLVRAVYVTRMTQLNRSMRQVLSRAPDDPVARIAAFVRHCANRIDGNRESWMVGSQLFGSIEAAPGTEEAVALRDEFEALLRTEIEHAMDMGIFRRNDSRLTTRMLLSWVNYIPRWHKHGTGLSAEQVCDNFLNISLNGLLLAPGETETQPTGPG